MNGEFAGLNELHEKDIVFVLSKNKNTVWLRALRLPDTILYTEKIESTGNFIDNINNKLILGFILKNETGSLYYDLLGLGYKEL